MQAGLLNPMTLLSPTAAAGADSTPKFADQNGAALLAMLQGGAGAPATEGSAVAGTPSKSGKAPKGVTLVRGEASYDIGAVVASGRKQTKVTAITIYNTDPGRFLTPSANLSYFSSAKRRLFCVSCPVGCMPPFSDGMCMTSRFVCGWCTWVVYVGLVWVCGCGCWEVCRIPGGSSDSSEPALYLLWRARRQCASDPPDYRTASTAKGPHYF